MAQHGATPVPCPTGHAETTVLKLSRKKTGLGIQPMHTTGCH